MIRAHPEGLSRAELRDLTGLDGKTVGNRIGALGGRLRYERRDGVSIYFAADEVVVEREPSS